MIGYKTLAVPGPTNMPFEVRQAMDVALEDHRRRAIFGGHACFFWDESRTVYATEGSP